MIHATWEENNQAAGSRWLRRGGGHGHDLFDWLEARNDLIMAKNFMQIAGHQLAGTPKNYLGVRGRPCRYCGKGKPEVKFKSEAHAIPEFMGNEALVDYNECDECNTFFSGNLENNLSEFLLPIRAALGMKGKTGIPTYKSVKSRIETNNELIKIKQFESDVIARFDETSKELTQSLTVKSYVPIGNSKCLTKMALAIMPDSEATHFDRARKWILTKDHAVDSHFVDGHFAYLFSAPGPRPFGEPYASLWKRRDDMAPLPSMVFVIGSANLIFQSFVPFCDTDDLAGGKRISFPRFGLPSGPNSEFGASTVGRLPLSSPSKVRGSTVTVTHNVDSFQHRKF